jgi:5-methylcytosine-specific restriction endonuclease McrA
MPHGGGIAQEANAPGKARGYADGGTVVWMVEPTDGVQAMPVPDGWGSLPWLTLEQELSRLQTRIYRASVRGDYPGIRKLQRLLLAGEAARPVAVRRVTQDNTGKKTAGVDGVQLVPPEHRLGLAASLRLDGEAAPVRRVLIPKPGTDELRPLGIPTIRDRALQTLVRLALEPEWEARFEPNSFLTLIKPSREAVRRQVASLREIVADHTGAPQVALIRHLNPVIRGWSNYYSTRVSKALFHRLDRTLTHRLLRWAYRRHGRRPRSWVVRKYWDVVPGRTRAFRCPDTDFRLCRHDDTKIVRHVKVRGARSPFDGDWLYRRVRLGRHPGVAPAVARLLKRQRGACAWCGLFFRCGDVWNVDRIVPKSQGGTDTTGDLQLLHRHCHQQKHRPPRRGMDDSHQATEEPDAGKLARPVLEPSGGSDPFA